MSETPEPPWHSAGNTSAADLAQHGTGVDWYGLAVATLCLIHCLALPALLVAVPTLLVTLGNEQVHQVLAMMTIPAVALLLYQEYVRPSGHWWTPVLAVLGASAILSAVFVPALEAWEEPVTVSGSLAFVAAHGQRLWRHRQRVTPRQ